MTETEQRLRLDPIACDGVGICLLLAPALVQPDSWGYPIVEGKTLSAAELKKARRAVRACPHRALQLD
jgi:ferredoxin